MTARVMGIDAGLLGMGVVIAEGERIVYAAANRTKKAAAKKGLRVADDDADRCQQHARFLLAVIVEWKPLGAVVELPSGGAQGARANRSMGMATGIVTSVLEAAGLPVEWVTPGAVKVAATGKKDASKDEVQAAVLNRFTWPAAVFKVKAEGEHIADAAGALLAARNGTLMRALAQRGA